MPSQATFAHLACPTKPEPLSLKNYGFTCSSGMAMQCVIVRYICKMKYNVQHRKRTKITTK